jgi:hypothetical protein
MMFVVLRERPSNDWHHASSRAFVPWSNEGGRALLKSGVDVARHSLVFLLVLYYYFGEIIVSVNASKCTIQMHWRDRIPFVKQSEDWRVRTCERGELFWRAES